MHKTCISSIKPDKIPVERGRPHKAPPHAKKLFAINNCWKREKSYFFNFFYFFNLNHISLIFFYTGNINHTPEQAPAVDQHKVNSMVVFVCMYLREEHVGRGVLFGRRFVTFIFIFFILLFCVVF